MSIRSETVKVTTTGAAGSATGTGWSTNINGEILSIDINYHASTPNTADITISGVTEGATYTIYNKDNSTTDVFVSPRAKPVDNTGTAITDASAPFPVAGQVKVALAGADALTDAVVVTLIYDDKVPAKEPPRKTTPVLV